MRRRSKSGWGTRTPTSSSKDASARSARSREVAIKIQIKAVPGSSRNCVPGRLGRTPKVRVTGPAGRGKANDAIEAVVAEALGIPQASVRVVTGTTSPRKVLEIAGLSESEVHRRLSAAITNPL